jgi:hypothetical protein
MQIKDLQQQLAVQQSSDSAAPPSSSAIASISSPHTPPLMGRSSSRKGEGPEGATDGACGTCGAAQGSSKGTKGSSVLQAPVPWWQHAVIAGLTAVSVAAYVQWESSTFWAGC